MKCSICGKEFSGLGHCPGCGQLIREHETPESVKTHWQAAQTETQRYESKLEQAAVQVRTQYRKIRNGRRIRFVLILAVALAAVFFLGEELLDNGVGYLNAWWAMEQGEYIRAAEMFDELDGDFLNAEENAAQCRLSARSQYYDQGMDAFERGDYRQALALFRQADTYSDAQDYYDLCAGEILNGMAAHVYHWSFDEDLSEDNGTPSESRGDAVAKGVVDSRIGGAAVLDGDGDYVTGGTGANMTDNWTLATLILPRTGGDMAVLAKMDWKTGVYPYRMYIEGGQLVWSMTMENGEIVELRSQSTFLAGEKWYLAAVVKEGSQVRLYVDGRMEASLTLTSNPMVGEQILTIGDQTYREEDSTLTSFLGCVADLAIYETALDDLELELMYQVREYDCTHPWDTSYYALPEEALRDHFVIYRSAEAEGRVEVLVFDVRSDREVWLEWYGDNFVITDDIGVYNAARYCMEGETWVLLESGMDQIDIHSTEVISSSLSVLAWGELFMEPLLIGGRD